MKNEKLSNDYIADKVCEGWFGNGLDRQKRLEDAGYDYNTIQAIVNKKMMTKRLEDAGYDYNTIQEIVNENEYLLTNYHRNMSNYRILKAMITECRGSSDISYIDMILNLAETIINDAINRNEDKDKEN